MVPLGRLAGMLLAALLCGASGSSTLGEEVASDDDPVVARVDGVPITRGEVSRFREQHLAKSAAPAGRSKWLDAAALELLIRQRLAVAYLERSGQAASEAEISAEIARLKTAAQRQGVDWQAHRAKHYGDEAALRRYLTWRLSWARHVARQSTDAALADYFQRRRRDFDGTRLRVSQVFWKADQTDVATRQKALAEARGVRAELLDKRITFAAAVEKYSQAPSRDQQGDLGWISRQGEMHESFAHAAFGLSPDEISEPVVTPHGVHLILVTEVRPGTKTLDDVRAAVEEQFARELFDEVVAAQRKRATIDIADNVAHVDPNSGQLVLPNNP